MLGKLDLECPICYSVNSIQLNTHTRVLRCEECGNLFIDMNIEIEKGKATRVTLKPIGGKLYE